MGIPLDLEARLAATDTLRSCSTHETDLADLLELPVVTVLDLTPPAANALSRHRPSDSRRPGNQLVVRGRRSPCDRGAFRRSDGAIRARRWRPSDRRIRQS